MSVAAASGSTAPESTNGPVADRTRIARFVGLSVVVLAIATSVASFLVLTGQTPIEPTPIVVRSAGIISGLVVLLLIGIVAYEAAVLWVARRRGRAAARLHIRIVLLFSCIAVLPAVLMAAIALVTLDKGLDRWFADRVEAIIDTSRSVAQAYVREHSRILALDLLALAEEFNRVTPNLEQNASAIAAYLTNQANLRGLSAIQLVHRDGNIIIEGQTTTNLKVPPAPERIFAEAEGGQPALIAPGTTNLVGGVIKLTSFEDVYLYLARPIDPQVTRYVRLTDENAAQYERLQENRFGVQVAFAILFIGMALVVLLSAIWIGLSFTQSLVSPIRRLIGAAREVSSGNLDVHVPVRSSAGDLGSLASTFNDMTGQLRSQRADLLAANDKIDERRRFIEAVLSGVSAGVIGLDPNARVTLANRSALSALDMAEGDLVGHALGEAIPAFEPAVVEARLRRGPSRQQVQLQRNGDQRTFIIQVTQERSAGRIEGFVVTLDDVTDLMAAQRRSAWADVARRIAHEIKNPLTPIQLSAERLKRKFGRSVGEDDRRIFDQCTDTIVRQVGDIRRMVDEFSGFARMPKPMLEPRDIREVVREAVFLQEVANPSIRFTLGMPEEPVTARIDHRLVTQALTNIVKNATEAIEGAGRGDGDGGRIVVRVAETKSEAIVEVEDNGRGLPAEDREKLLEPYMTTREKGTGLGLAIVRKIMEEHGGAIALLDGGGTSPKGALVRLTFPRDFREDTTEREVARDAEAV